MNTNYSIEQLSFLSPNDIDEYTLSLFRHQAKENKIYREFISHLNIHPDSISSIAQIPFLPIEFFKSQTIKTGLWNEEIIFESSGTTGNNTSRHYISSTNHYLKNTQTIFEHFYGPVSDYTILALLPSYLERSGSGLISMVNFFIEESTSTNSGFYLYEHAALAQQLKTLKSRGEKTILFGVTFALLDFAEAFPMSLEGITIIETGGMKGRRDELTRSEIHSILKSSFGVADIHSEYGMTELQSQAYSLGNERFQTPEWMQILIRDTSDPLSSVAKGKTGGINIIDLANHDTCAFIATQDLGKIHEDNSFEVLGRFDHSDTRGCSLLTL